MSRVLGSIRQNGYVVRDIEAALEHWTETLGVGPFWLFERVPVENFQYRGEPSPIELSIALANSGDLQIELIQQRNDAPSMYRDFLAAGNEGLQHVAYWSEDFDADFARAGQAGWSVGQAGQIGDDGRFVYFDTDTRPGAHPGTVVELSEVSGAKGRFFSRIAEAAASWDGADPIRRR
jgi:hypothetical protein